MLDTVAKIVFLYIIHVCVCFLNALCCAELMLRWIGHISPGLKCPQQLPACIQANQPCVAVLTHVHLYYAS